MRVQPRQMNPNERELLEAVFSITENEDVKHGSISVEQTDSVMNCFSMDDFAQIANDILSYRVKEASILLPRLVECIYRCFTLKSDTIKHCLFGFIPSVVFSSMVSIYQEPEFKKPLDVLLGTIYEIISVDLQSRPRIFDLPSINTRSALLDDSNSSDMAPISQPVRISPYPLSMPLITIITADKRNFVYVTLMTYFNEFLSIVSPVHLKASCLNLEDILSAGITNSQAFPLSEQLVCQFVCTVHFASKVKNLEHPAISSLSLLGAFTRIYLWPQLSLMYCALKAGHLSEASETGLGIAESDQLPKKMEEDIPEVDDESDGVSSRTSKHHHLPHVSTADLESKLKAKFHQIPQHFSKPKLKEVFKLPEKLRHHKKDPMPSAEVSTSINPTQLRPRANTTGSNKSTVSSAPSDES